MSEPLFVIRGRLSDGSWFAIRAWEAGFQRPNHTKLECELRTKAGVLFPREQFYVGIPGHQSIDGKYAKEAVTSLFCLKPGDTDADFFEDYTPEQLEYVSRNGEELLCWKLYRYGES